MQQAAEAEPRPARPLSSEQVRQLRTRVHHFDPDATAPLVHPEQPEGGLYDGYPAVRMANDVVWFWNREARPSKGDGMPMKARAPKGSRALLLDESETKELLVVEGEGDALAALSVGWRGVACAGGTNVLTSDDHDAEQERRKLAGKRVRVLFDPDDAGRKGALRVALQLLDDGAARVAIAELPGSSDLEEWLGTFETPEAAHIALTKVLTSADWRTRTQLKKESLEFQQEPVPVQSDRVPVEGLQQPILLCATWDPEERKSALSIYAPAALLEPEDSGQGGEHYQEDRPELGGP